MSGGGRGRGCGFVCANESVSQPKRCPGGRATGLTRLSNRDIVQPGAGTVQGKVHDETAEAEAGKLGWDERDGLRTAMIQDGRLGALANRGHGQAAILDPCQGKGKSGAQAEERS